MDPAPEGLIEVRTAPSGAGRRGRVDPLDWGVIVAFLRQNVWREFQAPPVPFNAVARLRQRYPDIRFKTFQRRWVELSGEPPRRVEMCDLYVTCTGEDGKADEDDEPTG